MTLLTRRRWIVVWLATMAGLALGDAGSPQALTQVPVQALAQAVDIGQVVYLPWLARNALQDVPQQPVTPLPPTPQPGPLRLSEIAPTGTDLRDEDGASSDWVEVHNSSDSALSLRSYALSDDRGRSFAVDAAGNVYVTGRLDGLPQRQRVPSAARRRNLHGRPRTPALYRCVPGFDRSGWQAAAPGFLSSAGARTTRASAWPSTCWAG